MIQDNTGMITEGTLDTCILNAVVQYSKRHPQTSVIDQIVGQDTYYMNLPESWETGFSTVVNILELVNDEPYDIEPTAWDVFHTPINTQIRRKDGYQWQSRYTYRIHYTIAHVLGSLECTIPEYHQDAILAYAAHQICLSLSAYTAQNIDDTLNNATVSRKTESGRWQALAEEYLRQWQLEMEINTTTPSTGPAMTSIHWQAPRRGGLFH